LGTKQLTRRLRLQEDAGGSGGREEDERLPLLLIMQIDEVGAYDFSSPIRSVEINCFSQFPWWIWTIRASIEH